MHTLDKVHNSIGTKDVTSSLVDAGIINTMSAIGVQQAKALTAVKSIDVSELVAAFRTQYQPKAHDDEAAAASEESKGSMWHRFGAQVVHRFRSIDCTSFM